MARSVAHCAADVDNASFGSLKERKEQRREVKRQSKVEVHHVVKILREGVLNVAFKNDSSAVDQDVNPSELLDHSDTHLLKINRLPMSERHPLDRS